MEKDSKGPKKPKGATRPKVQKDWQKEVEWLLRVAAAQKAPRKGRGGGRSCLDDFRRELTELYNAKGSVRILQLWLAAEKGIVVSPSTVYRRLIKWKEVNIRVRNKG